MAELATIARPYAEAAFKALTERGADSAARAQMADALESLAQVASHPDMRALADNPKVGAEQLQSLFRDAARLAPGSESEQLLRLLIDNGRLAALPEIARQFRTLALAADGVAEATISSAYPLEGAALAELLALLEKKFARKLQAQVRIDPSLIAGVRVQVGDEVLDTSVKARLEQMRNALLA
jgi:F-type H+-transporting ATPase subunit delta